MTDDDVALYSYTLFTQLAGAVTAGMIHLGDRLGLYRTLADADGAVTSHELASAAGLDERWVREWLHNQAAAKLIDVDTSGAADRFSLSEAAVAVLATPEHPAFGMGMFHRFPETIAVLDEMPESFRTGLGHDYDRFGECGAVGIERSFEPWNRHHLIPTVLPTLDGLIERLEEGITVADVGCGAGGAVLLMAEAFPNSRFVGYDISQHALARAEQRRVERSLPNARFVDPRAEPLSSDHAVDFVLTIDCLHDMTDPQGAIDSISAALAPDGWWLLVDIKARDGLAANLEKNPMASLMYGVSVLSCMSSALSEPGGAGLGTLGLHEGLAREMAERAGFTRFRRLDVDHPVNAFYEIRP